MASPVNLLQNVIDQSPLIENRKKNAVVQWLGRQVHVIYDFLKELCHGIVEGAKKVARAFAKLFSDSSSLARVCRLGVNTLTVIERCIGRQGIFSSVNQKLAQTDTFVNTISVLDQAKYFGTKDLKKESVANSLGNGALLVAGIVGVITFVAQMVLLGISKAGTAFGRTPAFSVLSKVTSGVSRGGAAVAAAGFSCFAVDAMDKIVHGKTKEEKVQGWINLAWNVAEVAFAILGAVACASIAAAIVLGSAAAVLGIASFLYSMHVEDQQQKQTPPPPKLI